MTARAGASFETAPVSPEVQARFRRSVLKYIAGPPRRDSIGLLREKTLHSAVKDFCAASEAEKEVRVGGYVADLFDGVRITEIQNGNFSGMREKLSFFLESYPTTIVYPIPCHKWVLWVDPESGEISKRSLSPVRGTPYEACRELAHIRSLLTHPGLTIRLLFIDLEEYRLLDGWSADRKRGSHRYDRMPLTLQGECLLSSSPDYARLVPAALAEPFTAEEFRRAAGVRRARISSVLSVLVGTDALERVGKRGRAWLYVRKRHAGEV